MIAVVGPVWILSRNGGSNPRRQRAIVTVHSAMAEPGLRSMPPAMITMVMPSAPIAMIAVCDAMVFKLTQAKSSPKRSSPRAFSRGTGISPGG